MEKYCLECNEPLHGRADKKFCSDSCRNCHNNKKKNSGASLYVRKVNAILSRNRHIMATLNPSGRKKIHRDVLAENGFHFGYITHFHRIKSGAFCYFCYDQGYLPLGKHVYLLVCRRDR